MCWWGSCQSLSRRQLICYRWPWFPLGIHHFTRSAVHWRCRIKLDRHLWINHTFILIEIDKEDFSLRWQYVVNDVEIVTLINVNFKRIFLFIKSCHISSCNLKMFQCNNHNVQCESKRKYGNFKWAKLNAKYFRFLLTSWVDTSNCKYSTKIIFDSWVYLQNFNLGKSPYFLWEFFPN